ncbi:MAG: TolC family protein [Melioribacteraceae bacterium]|nr:TolC family protein [Melioribacteraceae bacterium]
MKKIILMLFAGTCLLTAQEKVMNLDLQKAIQIALEKNTEIKVAKLEVDKSEEKLREARSGLFPNIEANGQYQRYIEKPVIFLPPGSPFGEVLEIGSNNSYLGTISARVPIFSMGLYDGIGVSSKSVELNSENLRFTEVATISNVKKVFYSVLLAREFKDVINQSLQNALDQLENVKRLNKQEVVSDYDLLRAEVQVENLRPQVIQAENNYEISKENLKVLIGLKSEQEINILGEFDYDGQYDISLQQYLDDVMKNNPQLAILNKQEEIANRTISLEKSAYFPSLSAFGNYQYQAQSDDFKFSDYKWVSTFVVGLQLQIPIFNGFKTPARVEQANITLNQVEEQRQGLTEAIKTQLQNVVYTIEQTLIRIKGLDKNIEQAQQGYEIAKTRFENDLGTQLEVNDAELALRQARLNRLQAIYDLRIAEAELQKILGNK